MSRSNLVRSVCVPSHFIQIEFMTTAPPTSPLPLYLPPIEWYNLSSDISDYKLTTHEAHRQIENKNEHSLEPFPTSLPPTPDFQVMCIIIIESKVEYSVSNINQCLRYPRNYYFLLPNCWALFPLRNCIIRGEIPAPPLAGWPALQKLVAFMHSRRFEFTIIKLLPLAILCQ